MDSPPGSGRWARATAASRSAQQTLEGAIDWSYQLLSEPERLLWARLSVFAGGFELDAAQAVCAGDGLEAEDDPGARRVARREVGPQATTGDAGDRFRLLEPLRQFGRERLREAGVEHGPATPPSRLDRRRSPPSLARMTPAKSSCSQRISAERANLWSALEFCLRDPAEAAVGAEICRDLWIYWASAGPATDVRRVLAALIELSPTPGRPRGVLLWTSAVFSSHARGSTAAARMATEALEIGRAMHDPDIVVWALQALGVAAYFDRRWDDTIGYATESLNLAETMAFGFAALSARVAACLRAHLSWRAR